jgi:hypothetical protein
LLIAQGFALLVLYLLATSLTGGLAAGGSGTDAISGFDVTDVAYGFVDDNPRFIDRVWFTVGEPDAERQPAMVKVQLTGDDGEWYPCDPLDRDAARWSCTLTPVAPVADADQLTVVAA